MYNYTPATTVRKWLHLLSDPIRQKLSFLLGHQGCGCSEEDRPNSHSPNSFTQTHLFPDETSRCHPLSWHTCELPKSFPMVKRQNGCVERQQPLDTRDREMSAESLGNTAWQECLFHQRAGSVCQNTREVTPSWQGCT